MSDEHEPAVTVRLDVKPDLTRLTEVPVQYVNFSQVRSNPEDTSIVLFQRYDTIGEVVGDRFEVLAKPTLILAMTTGHAIRLAMAILTQVKQLEATTGQMLIPQEPSSED